MERLIKIQQELRIKKDKLGDKGRFKFRSAEDIFEKVKPLLEQTKTAVVVSDELVEVGGKLAIKSTASLFGTEGSAGAIASATGYALFDKHEIVKRDTGELVSTMSNEQCTGSASSYARKYAMCGLFAIDNDEDDPDQPEVKKAGTTQPAKPQQKPAPQKPNIQPATKVELTEEQLQLKDELEADIDNADSMDSLKASVALAAGQPFEAAIKAKANKKAIEKGWYKPKA